MAMNGSSPTVLRRRLGIELRKYREAAGMTGDGVAEHLEWSSTKVSRIETGRVKVHHGDVRDLIDLYGVEDEEARGTLISLARQTGKKGWWHTYEDALPSWFDVYVGLEDAATSILQYQGLLVDGLLQTEHYARALIEAMRVDDTAEEVERRVALRMARQEVLTKEGASKFWFVLDEGALRRPVGNRGVMRLQLEHLLGVSEQPNVTLQVLPFEAGAYAAMGFPFTILDFGGDDPGIAYVESLTSAQYLERAEDVERYRLMFDHLRAAALNLKDSRTRMDGISKDL